MEDSDNTTEFFNAHTIWVVTTTKTHTARVTRQVESQTEPLSALTSLQSALRLLSTDTFSQPSTAPLLLPPPEALPPPLYVFEPLPPPRHRTYTFCFALAFAAFCCCFGGLHGTWRLWGDWAGGLHNCGFRFGLAGLRFEIRKTSKVRLNQKRISSQPIKRARASVYTHQLQTPEPTDS